MTANELRIGNLVSDRGFFEMEVSAIFKDEVYLDFEENEGVVWEVNEKDLQPIPLTEEWLLKFGFVLHDDDNFWFYKHGLDFCVTKDKGSFFVWIMDGDFVEIISVHQLQNLYFALTNEELTIK